MYVPKGSSARLRLHQASARTDFSSLSASHRDYLPLGLRGWQTPRFWKTPSSTNGVSWLARHGSVDCQVISPLIKSGMFISAWPAWTQRSGYFPCLDPGILVVTFPHQFTITIFTLSSSPAGKSSIFRFDSRRWLSSWSDGRSRRLPGNFFQHRGIYTDILGTRTAAWWSLEQPFTQVDRMLWRSLGKSKLATYRIPNNFK